MFIQAYLQTALAILDAYKGEEPFPSFLKKYFSIHKKFGSRDRRQITHLCFCFFRLGKSLPQLDRQERMLAGLFLCNHQPQPVLEAMRPQWNAVIGKDLAEKAQMVGREWPFEMEEILNLEQEVSPQVEYGAFARSFLDQPDTFLRLRPGKEQIVAEKLNRAGISFEWREPHCLAVAPSTRLDEVLDWNREAVIQDQSSQHVLDGLVKMAPWKKAFSAWDCCAASGGKSILLHDFFPLVRLTATDIRETILVNLRQRLRQANISGTRAFVADVSAPNFSLSQKFDLVLCDVPCSGSGTWSRTPEQLYFFSKEKISHYASLQCRIARNAAQAVVPGGYLVYITCSVFRQENEEAVDLISRETGLTLLESRYEKGYRKKADTLFWALFKA